MWRPVLAHFDYLLSDFLQRRPLPACQMCNNLVNYFGCGVDVTKFYSGFSKLSKLRRKPSKTIILGWEGWEGYQISSGHRCYGEHCYRFYWCQALWGWPSWRWWWAGWTGRCQACSASSRPGSWKVAMETKQWNNVIVQSVGKNHRDL